MQIMKAQSGFTLVELMMTLIIVSALTSIAYPVFDDQLEKSALAELVMRIDTMRTAATTSVEEGDAAVLQFSKTPMGRVPSELTGIVTDSMQYPGLDLMLARSSKDYQQFQGGIDRPYLVIAASNSESIDRLRALSDILPERMWAWWMPSLVLVVPLVDDQFLPGATTPPSIPNPGAGSGSSGSGASSGGGTSSGGTSGGGTTSTGTSGGGASGSGISGGSTVPGSSTQAGTTSSSASSTSSSLAPSSNTAPGNSGSAPGHSHHNSCSHPGNGHAFGRCSR